MSKRSALAPARRAAKSFIEEVKRDWMIGLMFIPATMLVAAYVMWG